MKPKIKRKKYVGGNGVSSSIWDTASVPSDVLAGMPQTDIIKMDPNQVTTSAQSTVGPLSGIQPEAMGSASPMSAGTANAITAAGTMGLNIASKALNSNAPKTTAGYMTRSALKGASTGASIGSTVGGIAGSFIPGVGNAVGGLAGATAGAQIGALTGATTGYFKGRKAMRNKAYDDQKDRSMRADEIAMQQLYSDQASGTQQTNPVYGMKDGGSLYDMGHMKHGGRTHKKHLSHHESGIVHSSHNGVDKTKASMPEGAFVIPANKRDQAIQDGILEDRPISPNQGGVPIMISGGDVSNPEREGVIMPGKVKQLLSMGVDLDKYAPDADHSIYDLAGTRKNVMHGGRLHYGKGHIVNDPSDIESSFYDFNELEDNIPETAKDVPPLGANVMQFHKPIQKSSPPPPPPPGGPPQVKPPVSKWNDEARLKAMQQGMYGLEAATQIGEGIHNARLEMTPVAPPTRFISQEYNPNVSAMDALNKEQLDIGRATALYNAREAGIDQGMITGIHANELEAGNKYNASRMSILENARLNNINQANQDRANYLEKMYGYQTGQAAARDQFRQMKAEALAKNISNLETIGERYVNTQRDYLIGDAEDRMKRFNNFNQIASQLSVKTYGHEKDYRPNSKNLDDAISTLSQLRMKNPSKYDSYASQLRNMDPIDAAKFMQDKV